MRRPAANSTFVRIRTNSGAELTVTPGHYVLSLPQAEAAAVLASRDLGTAGALRFSAWRYILPRKLRPGDWVPAVRINGTTSKHSVHPEQVASMEVVYDTGIYMPHTLHGALVVDGLLAVEMSDHSVPSWSGLARQRTHAACVRVLYWLSRVLPRWVDAPLTRLVSSIAHGAPDTMLFSRDELLAAVRERAAGSAAGHDADASTPLPADHLWARLLSLTR